MSSASRSHCQGKLSSSAPTSKGRPWSTSTCAGIGRADCEHFGCLAPSHSRYLLDILAPRWLGTTSMTFSHPLARAAKAWPANTKLGKMRNMLVIVTTLALDPKSKSYKKKMVDRLSLAAEEYLSQNPRAVSGFILVNRVRDWHSSAGELRSDALSASRSHSSE
jgi:hypothetical protein